MPASYEVSSGRRYPSGVSVEQDGVNFSVFSRHASSAELLLYEKAGSQRPFQVIPLDPEVNHTFFAWHVKVKGLKPGVYYTWRLDGPRDTRERGFRFDPRQELLDPWAKAVCNSRWDRWAEIDEGPQAHRSMRAIVAPDDEYDWEGDTPLRVATETMVIYELHVGGFTRHPSAGVKNPGTFAGLVEKIPYLQSLGITHVELMPIMAFDEQDVPSQVWEQGLKNFWGYSTHSFFSPHPGYCAAPEKGTHRSEFRDMVKALHKAGIGVILDVVFNHTSEGGAQGPHINFKGLGNETFYHLDPHDKSVYRDYTGCGNTVNANHPFVSNFILECLEYWVREMHVDGFRFDLASAMARGEDGAPMPNPPVLWGIEMSEYLAGTKIIAEAWDAAGLYQVGTFPGYRWSEWNGRYRDTVRRFVRGDKGLAGELATRIAGSSDFYQANWRLPINSVNFVTCHDGFTLWDLVSYNRKHNLANHEHNRDGSNENFSWNCGVEGATGNTRILNLRRRQAKNFLAILMLSQGIPMLISGDEFLRTKGGNNNTWCQDNELGWLNWDNLEENADMFRFVQEMIALRKRHSKLQRRRFFSGNKLEDGRFPDIEWHGDQLELPPWNDADAQLLAFTLGEINEDRTPLHVILNMSGKKRRFELPVLDQGAWLRAVDTSLASPRDIVPPAKQRPVSHAYYTAAPRSVVVLEAR